MEFNKRGFNVASTPMKVVYAFLGLVLLLLFAAELLPEVGSALESVGNISDLPLAGLFTGGVILMIIVAVIIIAVINKATSITK